MEMQGRLTIDSADAYTAYGAWVVENGWNGLLSMPPLKAVKTNDWHEYDGVEADLSAPRLDTRTADLHMAIDTAKGGSHSALIAALSKGAYHTFGGVYIERSFRLRLVGESSLTDERGLCLFTLRLADDFPMKDYSYAEPSSDVVDPGKWALDLRPLSSYGIRVLKGTAASLMTAPETKLNLLRDVSIKNGADYDSKIVTFKKRDVRLNCLMTAPTLGELWSNYDALLYDLTRKGERKLSSSTFGTHSCMYASGNVTEFYPDKGKAWLAFTLTLTLLGDSTESGSDTQ